MPSKKKLDARAKKKALKEKRKSGPPSERSRYGRKKRYLAAHGGMGFDDPEPKPWK